MNFLRPLRRPKDMQQEPLQPEQAPSISLIPVVPLQSTDRMDGIASETEATEVAVAGREKIKALEKVMQREANNRAARVVLLSFVPILFMLLLRWALGEEGFSHIVTDPTYLVPIILVIGVGLPLTAFRNFQKAREASRALATQDDMHAIGPLITAVQFAEDTRVSEPAFLALTRLLPRLRASDASLLTDAHQFFLRQVLSSPPGNSLFPGGNLFRLTPAFGSDQSGTGKYPGGVLSRFTHRKRAQERAHADFRVAILKAFEQVGDTKALPIVERLAHQEAKTEAEHRVREAAQECLPFLQVRSDRQRAHQTLLRASQPTEADPALLLRATGSPSDTDPRTLLRPNTTQEPS